MPNRDLEGKIAIITGAGSGIGAGIARVLHDRGATLALCDLFGESAEKTAKNLSEKYIYDSVDVTKISDLEKFRDKALENYGKIDILVSNAGVIGAKGFAERKNYSQKDWDDTYDVNLIGVVNSADAITDHMKSNKYGKIINIASHGGRKPRGLGDMHRGNVQTPYLVSKAAVIQYTHLLAIEMGQFNINVNAICPGSVDGDRIERVISADAKKRGVSPETIKEIYLRQNSLRKFTNANDISTMAYHLASKAGHGISGQAIAIDGNTEGLFNWLS